MKSKSIFKVFLLFFYFIPTIAQAQSWITRRICTNNGLSSRPKIAISGTNIYVVWDDETPGNNEIFLRSSKNLGATWSLQKNMSNTLGESRLADIVASGSYVYIVWEEIKGNKSNTYFIRSKDSGVTWSKAKSIASSTIKSGSSSSVAANEKQVYVTWAYNLVGQEIYFRSSNDAGDSWTLTKQISYASGYTGFPNLATTGNNVYIVWLDEPKDQNNLIKFNRSINNGKNWKAPVKLSFPSVNSWNPEIAVVDPLIYVVWSDWSNKTQTSRVCFRKSSDRGKSWGTNDYFDTEGGSIDVAASGKNMYVIWDKSGLVYCRSDDEGDTWIDPIKLSNKYTAPQIAVDETSNVYIVYDEYNSSGSNADIFLKYTKK